MSSDFVRLSSTNGEDLLARVGPDGARLTGGVGGTSTVDIPRDTQGVDWLTHPPYGMALSLMLDGWGANESVEAAVKTLYRMARVPAGASRPPTVVVDGPVPRTDLEWLIEAIDEDEASTLRRRPDGAGPDDDARVRQALTLTLVQDRPPELVVQQAGKRPQGRFVIVHAKKGQSLRKIAAKYHVKGGWRALGRAQHPPIRDPKLRHDRPIRVPLP